MKFFGRFPSRSTELERIDTGDYTPREYAVFLREIAFINKYLGDERALKRSLLEAIEKEDLREFSVLDVGCGSGEMLRYIARFSRFSKRSAHLVGIDLNEISPKNTIEGASEFAEITAVRGDAFELPFGDGSFDFAISSLFLHHLADEHIPAVLKEMTRVASRGIFIIDLERSRIAWILYRLFCFAFRISPLVTQDGALSVKKGFRPNELAGYSSRSARCYRSFPFRLVLAISNGLGASPPSSDGSG